MNFLWILFHAVQQKTGRLKWNTSAMKEFHQSWVSLCSSLPGAWEFESLIAEFIPFSDIPFNRVFCSSFWLLCGICNRYTLICIYSQYTLLSEAGGIYVLKCTKNCTPNFDLWIKGNKVGLSNTITCKLLHRGALGVVCWSAVMWICWVLGNFNAFCC